MESPPLDLPRLLTLFERASIAYGYLLETTRYACADELLLDVQKLGRAIRDASMPEASDLLHLGQTHESVWVRLLAFVELANPFPQEATAAFSLLAAEEGLVSPAASLQLHKLSGQLAG